MEHIKISTLISEDKIQKRIKEMGQEITERFKKDKDPLVAVCILKGSFMFYSDLLRNINLDLACDFLSVSSYFGKTKSSGDVKMNLDLSNPIRGKNVILIEDIVDTGLTMDYLIKTLEAREPKSITNASLLFKPDALKKKVELDYVGFKISNEFVVGYGLDYQGQYRNLPYIARVESMN